MYKLSFSSDIMIKRKTLPEFLFQSSFDVFIQDSFNIDVSLNMKYSIKVTQPKNCWKLCRTYRNSLSKQSFGEFTSSLSMLPCSLVMSFW